MFKLIYEYNTEPIEKYKYVKEIRTNKISCY